MWPLIQLQGKQTKCWREQTLFNVSIVGLEDDPSGYAWIQWRRRWRQMVEVNHRLRWRQRILDPPRPPLKGTARGGGDRWRPTAVIFSFHWMKITLCLKRKGKGKKKGSSINVWTAMSKDHSHSQMFTQLQKKVHTRTSTILKETHRQNIPAVSEQSSAVAGRVIYAVIQQLT